jgi:DNA-binding transcriptional LysR family regulator
VSQAIRALERRVGQPLLMRTTRSVSLTDAGESLLRDAAPALAQAVSAIEQVASAGRPAGRLRLSIPWIAVRPVLAQVMPAFLAAVPDATLEVSVEDRLVDIVAARFDAGIRLDEVVERDMVAIRLTPAFRFVVVGSPAYFAAHGRPRRPEDLARHSCLAYVSPTTGASYQWELEAGRREWRVPVTGRVTTSSSEVLVVGALGGVGLAYVAETTVAAELEKGSLEAVLTRFAPTVAGLFLYFPSRTQRRPVLSAFVEVAKRTLSVGRPQRRLT